MERLRCLKLVLPFVDGKELFVTEVANKQVRSWVLEFDLWEALCEAYSGEDLETQRGQDVPWPDRDGDTAKDYFQTLYKLERFMKEHDAVRCLKCDEWTSSRLDALECELCRKIWCERCAQPGARKSDLICDECPDFSKTHCWDCFAEGKTLHCMCVGTDSWHGCCGRHAFTCDRCDRNVCKGCEDRHRWCCPEIEDDENLEDEDEAEE
eukprot:Skav221905  [mRNA]  locus=scaffold1395:947433:948418:- [translate_table: standard]